MNLVPRESMSDSRRYAIIFFLALLAVFGTVLIRTAWVCDDAYISLRTSDNLVHGYGLTWNTDERVQAFTSPLWVLVMAGVYGLTGEMYFTLIFLSILLALLTVALVWLKLTPNRALALLLVLILLFSKAFIDYSTSGLENVLIHLLIVSFSIVLFAGEKDDRTLFFLSLIASLVMLTRIDAGLLVIPALLWQLWKQRSFRAMRIVVLGFAPFILWELFAIVYYGFPFPNTYYAKVHTGIPQSELLAQSFMYYLDVIQHDPLTIVTIAVGVGAGMWSKNYRLLGFALGIPVYLLYTVIVGCDFMLGRFLTAPLVCAVAILSQLRLPHRLSSLLPAYGLVLVVGLSSSRCALLTGENYGKSGEGSIDLRGIADERAWYYQGTGLLRLRRGLIMPDHAWAKSGLELNWKGTTPAFSNNVGFTGFFAGPKIHIVDGCGLTEPLLARLPNENRKEWRIGHFVRTAPAGYSQTLEKGTNQVLDSGTATYVSYLQSVTRGPVFSWVRFKHILKFNLGKYDTLLSYYLNPPVRYVTYAQVNQPKKRGTVWNAPGTFRLSRGGMSVALDSVCHNKQLEISLDHNDMADVSYFRDGVEIGYNIIERTLISGGGLRVDTLNVPASAYCPGYDRIDILPFSGDDLYSIGHVRLIGGSWP